MHPAHRYAAMLDSEILNADTANWIAVLPLGATEQHGTHLPAETDWIIASGIVDAIIEKLPITMPVTFLPTEKVGYSVEHTNRPGVQTFSYGEAIARWIGIGEQLAHQGIRKLVLLNAHGGNSPLLTIVAHELRAYHRMLAVTTSWTRFGYPHGIISEQEKALGVHGGEIETSVMLAIRPDLVTMSEARDFPSFQSELIRTNTHLRAYGPHSFGWMATDLNPHGVTGHAGQATITHGKALIEHAANGFIELLRDVSKFDITRFDRP
jgi:creatinine amidohydrolase